MRLFRQVERGRPSGPGRTVRPALFLLPTLLIASPAIAAEAPPVPEIPREFRDAPAVVLEDRRVWTIRANGTTFTDVTQRVLLQSREGFRHADQVVVYDASDSELEEFSARTILASGEVVEVGEDLIHDAVALKEGKQEWRMRGFTFPAVEVGAVLEWSYRLVDKEPLPWTWWEVQGREPVLEARFVTRIQDSPTSLRNRQYARRGIKPWCRVLPVQEKFSTTESAIVCEKVPVFEDDELAPPEQDTRIRLFMAYERSSEQKLDIRVWQVLNDYWGERIKGFFRWKKVVRKVARELFETDVSAEEAVAIVDEYLRENIELVTEGLEEGLAGRPGEAKKADNVLEQGSALPRELTLLSLALLREAGVEAYAVLVGDRSNGYFTSDLPDLRQAEHLMLQVVTDSGPLYWDPSCRLCRPGTVSWRYQSANLNGIRLDEKADPSEVGVPSSPAEENRELHEQTVRLEADGSAAVEGRVEWSGQEELIWRGWLLDLPEESRAEAFLSRLGGEIDEEEFEHGDLEDLSDKLTAEYRFRERRLALSAGDRLLLRPPDIFTHQLDLPAQEERHQELRWSFPWVVHSQVTFRLPEGYRALELPSKVSLDVAGLRFAARWRRGTTPDALYWVGELEVTETDLPAEDYERVLWFDTRMRKYLEGGVVLARGEERAKADAGEEGGRP